MKLQFGILEEKKNTYSVERIRRIVPSVRSLVSSSTQQQRCWASLRDFFSLVFSDAAVSLSAAVPGRRGEAEGRCGKRECDGEGGGEHAGGGELE